jgi:hypothetical protein
MLWRPDGIVRWRSASVRRRVSRSMTPTDGCGKARRFCFARQAQSLRLTDDLKGMANRSVEIPRLPTTEADGFRGRVEGSKRGQMTARSDEAPLQLFGVPVSGGEQLRGAREVEQRKCESREAD